MTLEEVSSDLVTLDEPSEDSEFLENMLLFVRNDDAEICHTSYRPLCMNILSFVHLLHSYAMFRICCPIPCR